MSQDTPKKLYGLAAEFTTTPGIYHAAEKVNEAGYKWFDCLVPFPVHGLDRAMGVKMTILPILVFCGGVAGFLAACVLQIFTNSLEVDLWALVPVVGYQFDVSGKPLLGAAAFVPVAFEMTVLFSALTAVFGTLFLNKLPMFYHPTLKHQLWQERLMIVFILLLKRVIQSLVRQKSRRFLVLLNQNQLSSWMHNVKFD